MWWLRYYFQFGAYSNDVRWELLAENDETYRRARALAADRAEELAREYSWSEHFRRVEWSVRSKAPRAVIETKMKHERMQARSCARRARRLKELLEC